jgi:nucleoside-diphosphate-sugar epimerase
MIHITGANGHLGAALIKLLKKDSMPVIGYARNQKKNSTDQYCKYESYQNLTSLINKGDTVIHCAAVTHSNADFIYFLKINKNWSIELYKECRNTPGITFIYLSSIGVYGYKGDSSLQLNEDSKRTPSKFEYYGRSKNLAEKGLINASKNQKTQLIIFRLGLIGSGILRSNIVINKSARLPLLSMNSFYFCIRSVIDERLSSGVYNLVGDLQPQINDLCKIKNKKFIFIPRCFQIGVRSLYIIYYSRNLVRFLLGKPRIPKHRIENDKLLATRTYTYDCKKIKNALNIEDL